MRLRHIELEHFLSHVDETISLPPSGLFFLDGESGFGKSSLIVDAVGYVLFGAKATRARQDELRTRGYEGDPMRVRCDFEFDDGTILALERGLTERGSAFARAYDQDGRLLAEGSAPVERLVRGRLGGLSWQQFYTAYVARQDEVDALLSATPARRKEIVHRLLGVREIELAEKETQDLRNRAHLELDRLQAQIGDRSKPVLQQRLTDLEHQSAEQAAALRAGEQRLTAEQRRTDELQAAIEPLQAAAAIRQTSDELRRRVEARLPELRELAGRVERSQAAKSLLADRETVATDLAQAERDLTGARAAWERLVRHEKLSGDRAAVSEKLNELRLALQPVRERSGGVTVLEEDLPKPGELRHQLDLIRAERDLLAAERARREQHQAQLCDDDACPTCQRPFEGAEREHVVSELRAQLQELSERDRSLADRAACVEALIPEAERADSERTERAAEIARVEAQIALLDEEIRTLETAGVGNRQQLLEDGQQLRDKVETLRTENTRRALALEQLDENAEREQHELVQAQRIDEEQLAALTEQLAAAPDPANLESLLEEQRALQTAIARLEGELPGLRASYERAETDLKAARAELQALEGLFTSREAAHETVLCLEQLSTFLDAYKSALAREIGPALEVMASEVLRQVSQGRFANVVLGDDYEVEVERDDGQVLKAALLSGGERTRLALALRLALTRLVSERTGVPLRLIVLDESLSSSDPGHVEATVDVLDALRDVFGQVFLISHVGELKEQAAVDYVLTFDGPGAPRRVELQYA
jgi:DNA repair protein SbcC/Rad50